LLGRVGKFLPSLTACGKDANDADSVLCSEMAVKLIDEPFIKNSDDREEWAL
jgi:hypothetical protein